MCMIRLKKKVTEFVAAYRLDFGTNELEGRYTEKKKRAYLYMLYVQQLNS